MKLIKWTIYTGFVNCEHTGEFDVPDNATEKEIEETLQSILNEYCEINYEVEDNGSDTDQ